MIHQVNIFSLPQEWLYCGLFNYLIYRINDFLLILNFISFKIKIHGVAVIH